MKIIRTSVITVLVASALCAVACSPKPETSAAAETETANSSAPPPAGTPRLVVQVVVDQMRGDYVERFRPLLQGGLAQLADSGVSFADAHHQHADTVTAAGHATLASGRHPARHGVIGNGWVQRSDKSEVYCVEDPEHGRSPVNMDGDAFGDRLKARYSEAKVISLGGKDRSAVLCGGHRPDGAFWYDRSSGELTTSTYYEAGREGLPDWLVDFHETKWLDQFFGTTWEPLLPLGEVKQYGIEPLDLGLKFDGFPYSFGSLAYQPDSSFYSAIYGTPFIDSFVAEAAKAAVIGEQLGQDDVPDFLSVAFSALDATGHGFGPDSPEMLDTLLRVDRLLADFFAFLEDQVGMEHVVISLSSDHGVGIVPELAEQRGLGGGRFGTEQVLCAQAVGERLSAKYDTEALLFERSYIDREKAAELGIDVAVLAAEVAAEVVQCEGIASAVPASELVKRGPDNLIEELLLNSYHPERSPDILMVLEPNWLTGSTTASHGSPYPYDTHVPWMLLVPGKEAGSVAERVATIDVMPTLAELTDVDAGEVDGQSRAELLR